MENKSHVWNHQPDYIRGDFGLCIIFLVGLSNICCIISKQIYLLGPAIELNGNEMEIFPNKDAVLLINNLLRNGQFTNKMGSLMRLFINKTVIHLTL